MKTVRFQTLMVLLFCAAQLVLLTIDTAQASDIARNEDVIVAFLAAADSHDWERLGAVITSDHLSTANGDKVQGEQALRDIWRGWWDYVPEFETEVLEFIPAFDPALAMVVVKVSGPGVVREDVRIAQEWSFLVAALVRIRDGRVAEWREFYDASEVESIGKP